MARLCGQAVRVRHPPWPSPANREVLDGSRPKVPQSQGTCVKHSEGRGDRVELACKGRRCARLLLGMSAIRAHRWPHVARRHHPSPNSNAAIEQEALGPLALLLRARIVQAAGNALHRQKRAVSGRRSQLGRSTKPERSGRRCTFSVAASRRSGWRFLRQPSRSSRLNTGTIYSIATSPLILLANACFEGSNR